MTSPSSLADVRWHFSVFILLLGLAACADPPPAHSLEDPEVEFTVTPGTSFHQVTQVLEEEGLVERPFLFRSFARLRGDDERVRAGTYRVPRDVGWRELLDTLVEGRVVTVALTVPEGLTLEATARRIAGVVREEKGEVLQRTLDPEGHREWDVPGPGLEGYLFPDTYRFAPGVSLEEVLETLVRRHRAFWTEARLQRLEELEMEPREAVTLASIVQAEARHESEMEVIASVFHNRLRIGMPLQADPTVQYALGERQHPLLYAHIEEVAGNPYNTYTHPGLPPGPIGTPGAAALDATLHPAESDYLYFVARSDGHHIFSRTLEEHNRARLQLRREAGHSPEG